MARSLTQPSPAAPAAGPPEARVVVADGNALSRRGLVAILRDGGFEVVAEAATVTWALQAANAKHPDCLIASDDLPNSENFELITTARHRWPAMGLIALSARRDPAALSAALAAGASVYLPKTALPAAFVGAVVQAMAAPNAFSAEDLLASRRSRGRPRGPRLSARELEVLTLAAEGLSVQQMSTRLFVAESTTKSHLSRIYGKLGVSTRAQALMAAIDAGLITRGG
ncbi:MAG: response regulator transcription factor [Candidatus Nanopelagicales bacterium]